MKNILNLIITFVVFWIGNQYFNDYASFADTKTLIIATVMMFVMNFIFAYAMLLSYLLIPLGIGCITTILLVIVAIFLTPVKLWVLDTYMPGVEINGFWTYVILSVVLSIFSVSIKRTESQKQ